MEINDLADRLTHHESASQKRFEQLHHAITEGKKMSDSPHIRNVFEPVVNPLGAMGGYGTAGAGGLAGAGAGVVGGLLGGALLNNGGLFGNRHGGDFVTPMQLQTATGSIIDAQQNTAVLQGIGDIKAAVPLAEAQAQLAIAQSQAAITQSIGQTENAVLLGQTAINKNVSDAISASLASQNNININVLTQGSATRDAVNAMGVANLTATANSTKEILAAINDQNTANLQRQLAVAESALLERNASLRARETEINITNTNTATAQQLQTQSMQQQQFQVLANLAAGVNNLANDIQAVRQGQVTFNSGTMVGSGTQSAANTKVG